MYKDFDINLNELNAKIDNRSNVNRLVFDILHSATYYNQLLWDESRGSTFKLGLDSEIFKDSFQRDLVGIIIGVSYKLMSEKLTKVKKNSLGDKEKELLLSPKSIKN